MCRKRYGQKLTWWAIRKSSYAQFYFSYLSHLMNLDILFHYALFYFLSLIHDTESIVFGSNFWKWDFDVFAHFDVPWIRKSHFLDVGLCVCTISVCFCYQHNLRINYNRNSKYVWVWALNLNILIKHRILKFT